MPTHVLHYVLQTMTLTVRLKREEEKLLGEAIRRLGRSRSDLVREALVEYLNKRLDVYRRPASERLAPWIGCVNGGNRDLSVDTGRKFTEMLLRKYRGRRSR